MLILHTVSRIFLKWRRVFIVFIFFQYSVIYNQYSLRKNDDTKKTTTTTILFNLLSADRRGAHVVY